MRLQLKVELEKKREQQVKILWTNVENSPQQERRANLSTTGPSPKGIRFNMNPPKEPRMDHIRREPLKGTAGRIPVTNSLQSVTARRDLETGGNNNNTEIGTQPGTTTAALPIG